MNRVKTVYLTFDDAVANHVSFVAPLLRQYGFGATFFVCEFPDEPAYPTPDSLTWEEIAQLDRMGFEIGNHTLHHVDLNQLDEDVITEEIQALDRKAAEFGIRRMDTFAYPGGPYCAHARAVLKKRGFLAARTCEEFPVETRATDPLRLPAYPVHGEDFDRFRAIVDQADGNREVVLVYHGVPDVAHPWVTLSAECFAREMAYLHENDFTVLALRELNAEKSGKK